MILDSKSIKYDIIDITEPGKETEKEMMQEKSTHKGGTVSDPNPRHALPPQVCLNFTNLTFHLWILTIFSAIDYSYSTTTNTVAITMNLIWLMKSTNWKYSWKWHPKKLNPFPPPRSNWARQRRKMGTPPTRIKKTILRTKRFDLLNDFLFEDFPFFRFALFSIMNLKCEHSNFFL